MEAKKRGEIPRSDDPSLLILIAAVWLGWGGREGGRDRRRKLRFAPPSFFHSSKRNGVLPPRIIHDQGSGNHCKRIDQLGVCKKKCILFLGLLKKLGPTFRNACTSATFYFFPGLEPGKNASKGRSVGLLEFGQRERRRRREKLESEAQE